jgi:hypothetical protein
LLKVEKRFSPQQQFPEYYSFFAREAIMICPELAERRAGISGFAAMTMPLNRKNAGADGAGWGVPAVPPISTAA